MSELRTKKRRIKLADYGRTICQGCDGSLDDGQPTTNVEGTEGGFRRSSSGYVYRTTHEVTRRVHTDCLRKSEEDRQARMQASKLGTLTSLWKGLRDSGTPDDEIVAMMHRAGVTDAEIEQIRAAVQ